MNSSFLACSLGLGFSPTSCSTVFSCLAHAAMRASHFYGNTILRNSCFPMHSSLLHYNSFPLQYTFPCTTLSVSASMLRS